MKNPMKNNIKETQSRLQLKMVQSFRSRKREVVEKKGKYKSSRVQKSMSKAPVYDQINRGNHSFCCCTETEPACCPLISASNYKNFETTIGDIFEQLFNIF